MKNIFKSEKETLDFAKGFAKKLKGGEVIGLTGELGAGKTVFAKGLAKGLGIKKNIQSPTFLLMKVYDIEKPGKIKFLVHIDAYRLKSFRELHDIGISDWLERKDVVTVIEWIQNVSSIFDKKKIMDIQIDFGKENDSRIFKIKK